MSAVGPASSRVLVVAAMPSELPRGLVRLGARSFVTGVGAPSAEQLAGEGPVIITGTCGALVPACDPPALVLADAAISADGEFRASPALTEALATAARGLGIALQRGAIATAEGVVESPGARADLAASTGAIAVDLESARLARACEDAGRPWAVLRIVSDGPGLPLGALHAVLAGLTSEPALAVLLARLAKTPRAVPRFLQLAAHVTSGRARVRRILAAALEAGLPGEAGAVR